MTPDSERIDRLEDAITRLVHQDDELADRLVRVTAALLQADQALADRLTRIERVVNTIATPGYSIHDTYDAARAMGFGPEEAPQSEEPKRRWWERLGDWLEGSGPYE